MMMAELMFATPREASKSTMVQKQLAIQINDGDKQKGTFVEKQRKNSAIKR